MFDRQKQREAGPRRDEREEGRTDFFDLRDDLQHREQAGHDETRGDDQRRDQRLAPHRRRQARDRRARRGRKEEDQHVVLQRLRRAMAIQLDPLGEIRRAPPEITDRLVKGSERADPSAEEPAEEDREHDRGQRPDQSGVQRLRGQ